MLSGSPNPPVCPFGSKLIVSFRSLISAICLENSILLYKQSNLPVIDDLLRALLKPNFASFDH